MKKNENKITKDQLDSLGRKIYNDLSAAQEEEWKERVKLSHLKNEKEAKRLLKLVNPIPISLLSINSKTLESMLYYISLNDDTAQRKSFIPQHEIMNLLHICTMEYDDLDNILLKFKELLNKRII